MYIALCVHTLHNPLLISCLISVIRRYKCSFLPLQKKACMAVRNLVARNQEYCSIFSELGTEALIRQTIASHSECGDEGKAALRDLHYKVELVERWKGEGRELDY